MPDERVVPTLDRAEPLSRNLNRSRYRYANSRPGWHPVAPEDHSGAWRLCPCSRGAYKMPVPSKLGRKVRQDYKFAERWQWHDRATTAKGGA